MSKPHVYFQTIFKTPAKFQKDLSKTVGGVALYKYPLIMYEIQKKDLVHKFNKKKYNMNYHVILGHFMNV